MSSKRFNKLQKDTSLIASEVIEKLIPIVKKNCTTKFEESIDLNLQINNKQKKKRNKFKNNRKYAIRNRK